MHGNAWIDRGKDNLSLPLSKYVPVGMKNLKNALRSRFHNFARHGSGICGS
jgi:hypothetical protein